MGLGELQSIGLENDFYYLPHQLLSSGFERLMKCYICFGYYEKHNKFPDENLFKRGLGHDLMKLKEHIKDNYFQTISRPVLQDDLKMMKDKDLNHLLKLLSEFGKFARYYNLDVVIGTAKSSFNVKKEWQDFTSDIVLKDAALLKKLDSYSGTKEVIDATTRAAVIILEKFARLLSRQFTLGELGKLAQQYSGVVSFYLHLNDNDLGISDYRKVLSRVDHTKNKPHTRTAEDESQRKNNPTYKSKKICKRDYDGEWPFYVDEVIIECREKHWCIVTIKDVDYALNGAAQGRYRIESVHDAGQAILGISIGEFNDLALELGVEK